jgi:hypothetical protein
MSPKISISSPTGPPAPTAEIGTILQGAFSTGAMEEFVNPLMDLTEWVPDLTWPTSVQTYHRMRSDTQLGALYRGATYPIRRYIWMIDPNDAEEEMVVALSKDLNLPIQGEEEKQPRRRRKRRFIFDDHLRKALLGLIYGHMFYEQVGDIQDDGKWHLRKLAERMPNTINTINVASDGGLISIIQNISAGNSPLGYMPEIPVDRLVGYVWDLEGGNWFGRSVFRECYKNWLIKDRLMRIDAINHARAGGVPIATAPPEATTQEVAAIGKMAQEFRIGETSGGAVPYGTTFDVVKSARASTVDSMRYHDEAMARFFLMMFMQLGQTRTGSRALGSTFVDFFKESQDTIATWFSDIFDEHVIEDWVDWNYGEDVEVVPLLVYKRDPELAVQEIVQLIDAGAIIVDKDLEKALRDELGLPDKASGSPNPKAEVKPGPPPPPTPPKSEKQQLPSGGGVGPDGKPLAVGPDGKPVPAQQQPQQPKSPAKVKAADGREERTVSGDGGLLPPSSHPKGRPLEAVVRFFKGSE